MDELQTHERPDFFQDLLHFEYHNGISTSFTVDDSLLMGIFEAPISPSHGDLPPHSHTCHEKTVDDECRISHEDLSSFMPKVKEKHVLPEFLTFQDICHGTNNLPIVSDSVLPESSVMPLSSHSASSSQTVTTSAALPCACSTRESAVFPITSLCSEISNASELSGDPEVAHYVINWDAILQPGTLPPLAQQGTLPPLAQPGTLPPLAQQGSPQVDLVQLVTNILGGAVPASSSQLVSELVGGTSGSSLPSVPPVAATEPIGKKLGSAHEALAASNTGPVGPANQMSSTVCSSDITASFTHIDWTQLKNKKGNTFTSKLKTTSVSIPNTISDVNSDLPHLQTPISILVSTAGSTPLSTPTLTPIPTPVPTPTSNQNATPVQTPVPSPVPQHSPFTNEISSPSSASETQIYLNTVTTATELNQPQHSLCLSPRQPSSVSPQQQPLSPEVSPGNNPTVLKKVANVSEEDLTNPKQQDVAAIQIQRKRNGGGWPKGKKRKRDNENSLKRPKLPLTGYAMYLRERRKQLIDANPEMSMNDINKELGQQWSSLKDREKWTFTEKAVADRKRYLNELRSYLFATLKESTGETAASVLMNDVDKTLLQIDKSDNNTSLFCKLCSKRFSTVGNKFSHLDSKPHLVALTHSLEKMAAVLGAQYVQNPYMLVQKSKNEQSNLEKLASEATSPENLHNEQQTSSIWSCVDISKNLVQSEVAMETSSWSHTTLAVPQHSPACVDSACLPDRSTTFTNYIFDFVDNVRKLHKTSIKCRENYKQLLADQIDLQISAGELEYKVKELTEQINLDKEKELNLKENHDFFTNWMDL